MNLEMKKEIMGKVKIRQAKSDESEMVADIYESEGSSKEAKVVKKVVEKEFQEILTGKRIVLFAEVNKQPVGTIQLIFDSSNKEHADGKNIAHLHHLKVHKRFCKKGFGETLSRKVEGIAKQKGFKRMTAGVDEDNPYAKRLYEKWGYKLLQIEPGRTKKLKLFILYKDL